MPTVVFSKPPKISEPVISTIAEPPPVAEAKMVPLVLLSSLTSSRRMALLNPPSNPPAFATIVPELVPNSKKTLVLASLFARANAMRVPPLLRVRPSTKASAKLFEVANAPKVPPLLLTKLSPRRAPN